MDTKQPAKQSIVSDKPARPAGHKRSAAEEAELLKVFTRVHSIMDAARAGDKAAFAEIITLLTPLAEVHAQARWESVRRTSLQTELTEDIFRSAALEKIVEIIHQKKSQDFESPEMLRNFTVRCVQNQIITVVRNAINQRRLIADRPIIIDHPEYSGGYPTHHPAIASEDPEILHHRFEAKKREVLDLLKSVLTPDQFRVFSVELENPDIDAKDVGVTLGMDETAVRSHRMRGRRKIEERKTAIAKLEDILSADMPSHRERAAHTDEEAKRSR